MRCNRGVGYAGVDWHLDVVHCIGNIAYCYWLTKQLEHELP